MSRVIYYFSSEFGWTVDEILRRTIDELELLLEAGLEKQQGVGTSQSHVPTLNAENPDHLKAFARQVGVRIIE